ncbi:MAG TPA: carboxylesterase family protein [Draconibacterium sp.]|nr:carboxylesterase family protein [Draconibacterium sp.]
MKTIPIITILLFSLTGLNAQIVDTQFGQIQGSVNGHVYQFLGIPFARPPVDSLRWKAPQNPESWPGIMQTTDFSPVCPQKRFVQGDTTFTIEGEEDCLYLNIWTPDFGNFNFPVLVFIHGGGNQQGGASQMSGGTQMYSGKNMAERGNVVVVTIQYRLGPLGFLVHPGLEAENKNGISGNYAVLDQILALTWIQNNIELFGGDPTKVMIFGESAGGVNVGNLLTTSLAKGLFQRACIQSASPVINLYEDSRNKGIAYVDSFTAAGTEIEKIAFMRSLPADSLLHFATSPLAAGVVQMNWQPVVDNFVFHGFPKQVFQSGNYNKVPLIIGSNADEMSLSAPQTVLPIMVTALIKKSVPTEFQAKALELYPPGSNSTEAKKSYIGILTDAQFTVNARRTAQCISMNQTEPVWRYFFTHKHTIPQLETLGSYHGMELFYVFNNWENTLPGSGFLFKPEDDSVQNVILNYWVNFADTGNPNGGQPGNWSQYVSLSDNYMEIKATPDGTQAGLRTEQSDLWDNVTGFSGCTGTVFSKNVLNQKTLQVYPNPSNAIFRFNVPENDDFEVAVYNSSGQKITIPIHSNQIDLKNQNNGIYYLEIKTNDKIFRSKIIKSD